MESGARLCMTRAGYCTTEFHARLKGVVEELPGGEVGFLVVMEKHIHIYWHLIYSSQVWEHLGQHKPRILKAFR